MRLLKSARRGGKKGTNVVIFLFHLDVVPKLGIVLAYCEDKMSRKINKQSPLTFFCSPQIPRLSAFPFIMRLQQPLLTECDCSRGRHTLTLHVRPFFRMLSDPEGGPLLLLRRLQQVSHPLVVDLQEAAETEERGEALHENDTFLPQLRVFCWQPLSLF